MEVRILLYLFFSHTVWPVGSQFPDRGGRLTPPAVDMWSLDRGPPGGPSFPALDDGSPLAAPGWDSTLPVHGGMKSICAQELGPHGLGGMAKTKSK